MAEGEDGKHDAASSGRSPKAPERPVQIYRQDVQLTPFGTENRRVLTPEGREYLAKLEAEKREFARAKSLLKSAPLVPRRSLRVEEKKWERGDLSDTFNKRSPPTNGKDKDPDLEL